MSFDFQDLGGARKLKKVPKSYESPNKSLNSKNFLKDYKTLKMTLKF